MHFIYYIIIGVILTQLPYVGKYFRIYNTLIHEIGHVLASLVTNGKVYHIELNKDASGLAYTGSRSRISQIIVSLAGYPTASIVSYLAILLLNKGYEDYVLAGIATIILISLVFWVRNWFGFGWLLLAAIVSAFLVWYESEIFTSIYLNTLVAVIFVESVISTIELIYITYKDKNNAGDSRNLKLSTGIPEMFWSVLFFIFAGYTVYLTIRIWI